MVEYLKIKNEFVFFRDGQLLGKIYVESLEEYQVKNWIQEVNDYLTNSDITVVEFGKMPFTNGNVADMRFHPYFTVFGFNADNEEQIVPDNIHSFYLQNFVKKYNENLFHYAPNGENGFTIIDSENDCVVASIPFEDEVGVAILMSHINNFINNYNSDTFDFKIKNDNEKLGIIVDVWGKDVCINTACYWFEDFFE